MSSKITEIKKRLQDKIQKLSDIELDVSRVKNLDSWLRMELTYSSNAIEGNTLTRQETKLVVEDNISVGGKSVYEILEVKNHDRALDLVLELSKSKKIQEISAKDILDIHAIILQGINDTEKGKYRNAPVRISGSMVVLPNYLKVDSLMDKMIEKLSYFNGGVTESVELATEAHYELVSIHPFIDGNGRVGRLLFNLILLQSGLPLSFIKTDERRRYLSSLEKAQLGGSKDDYTLFMLEVIERSVDIYIGDKEGNGQNITLLKIGEFAKKCEEDVSTIRYWTKIGLISTFGETKSGYSLYSQDSIEKVKQIRKLQKEQRLTLEEIKELLK